MSLFKKLMIFISMLLIGATMLMMIMSLNLSSNQFIVLLFSSLGIILIGESTAYLFLKSTLKPLSQLDEIINKINFIYLDDRSEKTTDHKIEAMVVKLNQLVEYLETTLLKSFKKISEGDFVVDLKDQNIDCEAGHELYHVIESIEAVYFEIDMIVKACQEGKLDIRGNEALFNGKYKKIISSVNTMLDAITVPVSTFAEYICQIGNGERPELITETYNGQFEVMKNSVNSCIKGLAALEECNRILSLMSKNDFNQDVEGNFSGIYSDLAKAINLVNIKLVRVVEISTNIGNGNMCDLDALRKVPRQSENDRIIPCLIRMIENIIQLVEETEKMAEIAVEGDLSNRGDVSKFNGEYARVVGGFNQILDAVIAPVIEASDVLQKLSQGDLSSEVIGDYRGDHAQIKNALNQTISFLKQYVSEIIITLNELGNGNLNQDIITEYLGDFLPIKNALNEITSKLNETMSDINLVAGQVEVGAQQISDGGQALAQGTTEQASSIQELTASIEEVAAETSQNAINANEANELALVVLQSAVTGNEQMSKLVTAMVEINESSSNISKIIKVIDDIAFQTNILALNAAVEAARAGQQGKGFAVVAEEVRTLAARSADAAKETTILIEGSIEKAKAGSKIADDTAESLSDIQNSVEKVANLVGNIARASNDQASEIAQINQGIDQVSMVVQTNSATAEESAAASEELSGQAEFLKKMVDTFQLKI
ncbi:methyl-accepting chemotaxis protein [Acetobacterium malicum]|uniref:Methyl-accepting chemotaxis protein n=1 Tax=Acetobacterium malicum TaxID=52692 RepID=A0ABR6Z1P8_9FIRM|nr:methyl-accepting chemotaxis protein [Acetobacterium malicum]MBC3901348.1 methyl-accepting chemotaxis protein [Acetobacterium malicum]